MNCSFKTYWKCNIIAPLKLPSKPKCNIITPLKLPSKPPIMWCSGSPRLHPDSYELYCQQRSRFSNQFYSFLLRNNVASTCSLMWNSCYMSSYSSGLNNEKDFVCNSIQQILTFLLSNEDSYLKIERSQQELSFSR